MSNNSLFELFGASSFGSCSILTITGKSNEIPVIIACPADKLGILDF